MESSADGAPNATTGAGQTSWSLLGGTWNTADGESPDEGRSFGGPSEIDATSAGGSGGEEAGEGTGSTCGATPTTLISSVQGSGTYSPLVDQRVVIEGVVVADFQGSGAELGGFFVQSEIPDADAQTSDGVFVYDGDDGTAVAKGQRVRVAGTVKEYFGLTEIVAESVVVCGAAPLPTPIRVELPYGSLAELEAREGMLVQLRDLTVTETYDLGRYGEVMLSAGGRLAHPQSPAAAEQNARRRIILDDARDRQNLTPVPYLANDGTLRLGDTIDEVVAVLHYAFGQYRLQPLSRHEVAFVRKNPRLNAPAEVGGDVRVGALNVLNYFTTLGERGASTPEELARQRTKLVSAVLGMNVDVLGLMEIENTTHAVDDFVTSINAAAGRELYARAPDPSWLGDDAIRAAIIYKPSRVRASSRSTSAIDPVFERPPVAHNFSYLGNPFSVVVVHLKSKSSCPGDPEDVNADWGQGCWNALRVEQANALLRFVAQVKAETSDPDVVVVGDLNSQLNEDPVQILEQGGLLNHTRSVPQASRYSYVFAGEAGLLDYGMTTPELSVAGATIWHINADEPRVLDYNQEYNPSVLYQPDAYRSSDHDPVILGLSL